MKRVSLLLLAAFVGLSGPALADSVHRTPSPAAAIHSINGSPKWVGAISASTSAAHLTVRAGKPHIINCGAAAYFRAGTSSGTVTTSSTNMGLPIEANKNTFFTTTETDVRVSVILSSGTTTCNVWELF